MEAVGGACCCVCMPSYLLVYLCH